MSWLPLIARLVVGLTFVSMGAAKIEDPVVFLKLIREYGMLPEQPPWMLNSTAVVLPWLEVLCGVALVFGVAVRGTALVLVGMLAVFTTAIAVRALGVMDAEGIAYCAVAFDCGCGGGPQNICRKLTENGGLLLASLVVLIGGHGRWGARPGLFGRR